MRVNLTNLTKLRLTLALINLLRAKCFIIVWQSTIFIQRIKFCR